MGNDEEGQLLQQDWYFSLCRDMFCQALVTNLLPLIVFYSESYIGNPGLVVYIAISIGTLSSHAVLCFRVKQNRPKAREAEQQQSSGPTTNITDTSPEEEMQPNPEEEVRVGIESGMADEEERDESDEQVEGNEVLDEDLPKAHEEV